MSNGAKLFPKERVERLWEGKAIVIENWGQLRFYGIRGPFLAWPSRLDKGHAADLDDQLASVQGKGDEPDSALGEITEVSRLAPRAGVAASAWGAHEQ